MFQKKNYKLYQNKNQSKNKDLWNAYITENDAQIMNELMQKKITNGNDE